MSVQRHTQRTLVTTVQEEIKKQIIAAVDDIYLTTLDDSVLGFADVTIAAMLTHLRTAYGPIMWAKLKHNHASIATIWTLDDPIEILCEQLCKIQQISVAGNDPLTDNPIIDLTFTMFKNTGVFTMACDTWHVCPAANQTLIKFCMHFTSETKSAYAN